MKKTVLVTGTAQGIGASIVEYYREKSWFVIALDITPTSDCGDLNIAFDLREYHNFSNVCAIMRQNNISTLNALVNNAAMQILTPFAHATPKQMEDTMKVNTFAPYFLIQAMLPFFNTSHSSIVNISSIHAKLTKPNFTLYATSKAALSALTRNLALELSPRIRVNSVAPAATDTEMLKEGFKDNPEGYETLKAYHPMRRFASPREIVEAVYFLTNEECHFMTGAELEIHGGIGSVLHDPDTFSSHSH